MNRLYLVFLTVAISTSSFAGDEEPTDSIVPKLTRIMVPGLAAEGLTYPMFVAKNRIQLKGALDIKPRELLRGYTAGVGGAAPYYLLAFGANEYFDSLFPGVKPVWQSMSLGMASGAIASFYTTPWNTVLIQQNLKGEASFSQALSNILANQPRHLSRGFLATCARDSLYTGCILGLSPSIRRFIKERTPDFPEENPSLASFVTGASAGSVAAIISQPFDTLKTKMQGVPLEGELPTLGQVFRDTMSKEGIKAFWRGGGLRGLIIITGAGALITTRDAITAYFDA